MAKFTVAAILAVLSTFAQGAEIFENFLSPKDCEELVMGPISELYGNNEDETDPMVFYELDKEHASIQERVHEAMSLLTVSSACDANEFVGVAMDSPMFVSSVMSTVSIRNNEYSLDDDCPRIAFVCLEDNDDAFLVDGDQVNGVKQGQLVIANSVNAIIDSHSNNPVHLLGPFDITNAPVTQRQLWWGSKGGKKGGKGGKGGKRKYYPGPAHKPAPYPAPKPAPYPAPKPAPFPAPKPFPYPAPKPAPFPAPKPFPYPAPKPFPYPAPKPFPYPAPKPAPFPAPKPAPYHGPSKGSRKYKGGKKGGKGGKGGKKGGWWYRKYLV